MKLGLNRYRLAVLAGFCLLFLVLAVMVTNVLSQGRNVTEAAADNLQWSISQIDTEFANLDATLAKQIESRTFPDAAVQLRVDIALSRLKIINSGRSAAIFAGNAEASQLIAPINAFAEAAIALSDAPGPLAGPALIEMQRLVEDVRPFVRNIALLGIRLGAAESEARRTQFAQQLSWTAGIAIALLVLMAALMIVLDRLLRRAERRDAELSASTKQLASTVKASLDAIVTADTAGRIIDFNTSAEQVFGWTRDEIVGLTMEETFIPHRMRDAHLTSMARFLETGQPHVVDAGRIEMAALRKSGEEFPVEINITSVQDGDQTRFIAYLRDISGRKINEQKLIDARDQAERTDKAKSQFLTVMSHEMRTPLNGVLGVLDLLKSTKLTPHQQRYAQIATSSSEVLLEHVNEALDITRIETGKLHLALQDFDLAEVMRGLMDMFEPLAQEKDLSCTLTIEEAMRRRFYGDAGRLRQILTNLIGNAIKFTETGGVHIAVHGINGPETSSLRFEVSDTGIGVPADQQEQVFEDFFAIASSEGRQDRGDGLGLSISRRIARAMDGDVTMRTAQDAGSTFVLTLPLLRSEGHAVARAGDADAPAQACNILIVEDNIINRGVLGDMLLAMGHHVSEAVNGADCLEKAQDQRFDIIFMDIGMPVMNGIDATQRLRAADGPNAKTHVIGLTAHGREEYRDTALTAGMNRFHTKPIRLDALHSIIAELTSGPLTKDEPAKVGDALQEMLDVLGPEKVRNVADAFLAELATLVSDLRAGADTAKPEVLAEAAHKAKGASSLLGQVDLEDELGALEIAARAGALSDASGWADRLAHGASTSAAVFDTVIPTTASSKVD